VCCIDATPSEPTLTTLRDEFYSGKQLADAKTARPTSPSPRAGEGGVGEGRVRWSGRERPRRSCGAIVAYDPLDPLELEPWSGGAGVEGDAAGLELGGGAATGDAGFGAM
jgi:hypothetical protein